MGNRLRLRWATTDDAPKIAQLAFDVIEESPIDTSYRIKSIYTSQKKRKQEIGGDPALYAQFLQHETSATDRDIRAMRDEGRKILVAVTEDAPDDIVGCVTYKEHVHYDPHAMISDHEKDWVIEKIFAAKNALHNGKTMLDTIKLNAKCRGVSKLIAYPAYGVHHFFAENGFRQEAVRAKPYDNRMVLDFYSVNANFARDKPSLRVFPKKEDVNAIVKYKPR